MNDASQPVRHQDTEARPVDRLLAIMARLRDPERGCPWDREQTFATIAPHTIEEAYEVADAIDRGDMAAIKDELGDLLFQVVFYAQIAHERGDFDFEQIAETISEKMIRRHPHVFGKATIESAEAQTKAWEEQKADERRVEAAAAGRRSSVLDGVIAGLPALTRAMKLQKRAARVGFDWPSAAPVFDKIAEEAQEIAAEIDKGSDADRLEDEVGDLLFTCVNLARHLKIDPDTALRRANRKFDRRFRKIEAALAEQDRTPADASLDEMDALWRTIARAEHRGD
jgi:ATP diphosphatase